jgi:DNA-binding MarR family transcriptional regulator
MNAKESFVSKTSQPTEQSTRAKQQDSSDGVELLQQFRSTLLAIKSAFDHSFELSQARLFIFQEVQGAREVSQSEIHQKLGVDPAFITRIVKQMEAAGQITRRPDPTDNRYTLVRLTELGQRQYEEIMLKIGEMDSLLLQGLSPEEILALQAGLKRIQENAEAQMIIGNDPLAKAS